LSRQKLRVKNTQLDNLVSNLRGEVGEIITSWVLLRHMMASQHGMFSDDPGKDMANESLAFVSMLREKLADEIVARLSELAEPKIGRLTFHFAAVKLGRFEDEVRAFSGFIARGKFHEKRNYDISHKELPEEWDQHQHLHIPYRTMLRGIAMALRLMKRIDRLVIGPAAKHLWREMRKRRYKLMNPAKAAYLMLPHLNLTPELRTSVILEEMEEGRAVWSDMASTINGKAATVSANREWGAFLLGGRLIVLDHYPLQELKSIEVPDGDAAGPAEDQEQLEPITEQKSVTGKYRVTQTAADRVSFAPVQRVQRLDGGGVTELVDIHLNLHDEKLRRDFGGVRVGDEKEFTLGITVVTGFRRVASSETDAAAPTTEPTT
jgi:hypothetical protein